MRDEWMRSDVGYRIIAIMTLPIWATLAVVAIMRFGVGLSFSLTVGSAFICASICAAVAFILVLLRRRLVDILRSQRRSVVMGFQDVRKLLERAIASSGLPGTERPSTSGVRAATWEVRGGITLELLEGTGRCDVYVGPVNDSTRRDVEGLKRAIDAELAHKARPDAGPKGRQA